MVDSCDIQAGWRSVNSATTTSDFSGFLKAVDVWIERPQVVNRRLMGALIVQRTSLEYLTNRDLERSMKLLFNDQSKYLFQGNGEKEHETTKQDDIHVITTSNAGEANVLEGCGKETYSGARVCEEYRITVIVRKLLPKQMDRKDAIFELVILERSQKRVSFFPLSLTAFEKDGLKSLNESMSYCLLYQLVSHKEQAARLVLQVKDSATVTSTSSERDGILCPTIRWLQDHLLPKLCKWAEENQTNDRDRVGSLRLVPLDQYTLLYHRLKQDYGEKLVKIWPERTDPQKFVYEDIAIASYLLIVWKEERDAKDLKQKQSFVDLGCGNGLLVHILSEEGHPGTGIDVRRRKIWDLYGENTILQEMAIDPTKAGLFPGTDWLIGNHSDELTPWIPVMAVRSSYTTRYFVLPCCFFDFNCKFIRKNSKLTQYRGYLDFVLKVGETCGFQVEEDSLRIPSTKRICQMGRLRTFPEENAETRERLIKGMMLRRGCDIDGGNVPERDNANLHTLCNRIGKQSVEESGLLTQHHHTASDQKEGNSIDIHEDELQQPRSVNDNKFSGQTRCYSNTCPSQVTSSTFRPRPSKESMRNCTALDKSLKDLIVNTVARKLLDLPLKSDRSASISHITSEVDKRSPSSGALASKWRRGGELQLSEVAMLFGESTLFQLKNECGGLQTLLRNHHCIFKVAGGVVQMRDWTQESLCQRGKKKDLARKQQRSQALWKTSMCWFNIHHPDGCPVLTEQCSFAHTTDELRERPPVEYQNSL